MLPKPVIQANPFTAWFWVLRGIIFVISITGNGLVMYLIRTRPRLIKIISNWFVLSLAIADLLVTSITLPEFVYAFFFGNNLPWSYKVAYDVALEASVFNLCALTFERYVAVVHPLKYAVLMCNHRVVLSILAVSWAIGLVSPWPYYICYRLEKFTAFRYFQVAFLSICELLPTIALLVPYVKMVIVVRKQESLIQKQSRQVRYNYGQRSVQKNRQDKINRSSIQVIGVILLILELCYAFSLYKGLYNYVFFRRVSNCSVAVARILYQVNSAANGYVYALMKHDFKLEVKRLVKLLRNRTTTNVRFLSTRTNTCHFFPP